MEQQYKELASLIIKKQSRVIGQAMAVKKANRIEGLEADDDGSIKKIGQNYTQTIEDLVNEYSRLAGAMAIRFCKEASESFIKEHPEIDVPTILK